MVCPDEQHSPGSPHVRADLHAHSIASNSAGARVLGLIDRPECFSPPEKVYEQARARGMDLVAITDHDTIDGAMALRRRGFAGLIVGEEVTTFFPEDHCKLHVLVWGLSEEQHEQIGRLGLRSDVYALARWIREQDLAHSLAHPLYAQNGRLEVRHIHLATLLFKCFETLNGAHTGGHRVTLDRYLDALSPERIDALSERFGVEPVWPRVWIKGRTGGSDDHGLLNVGRTYTSVPDPDGRVAGDPHEFLAQVMAGRSEPGGAGGSSSLLAHQFSTVGAHAYASRFGAPSGTSSRLIASKLMRFAGVDVPRPGRARLALHAARRRLGLRRRRSLPIVRALRDCMGPMLDAYPELRQRLDPSHWVDGVAMSDHERMARFSDELADALMQALRTGAMDSIRRRDRKGIVEYAISYALIQMAQVPYLISLFQQNKERELLARLERESCPGGDGEPRRLRLCLVSDTIGDVNGVCRFIEDMGAGAQARGCTMEILSATTRPLPALPGLVNFEPALSGQLPGYAHLDVALPPVVRMLRHVEEWAPDVIHVSTPGPVGCVGYLAARMLHIPVVGVYHTDFPAYVDRLFEDHALTRVATGAMRAFYSAFGSVLTRSEAYARAVVELGVPSERVSALPPSVDLERFHPRHADPALWSRLVGESGDSLRVLYVGRISVEKDMPFLSRVWRRVQRRCCADGIGIELVLVGDGPCRRTLERELRGRSATFLGFRGGRELSSLYAGADLFVFPSTTDTLGQVVLEAQASGLGAVVCDRGGPAQVVDEGRSGLVLPAHDESAWEEALIGLARDRDRVRAMGQHARRWVERFSVSRAFEAFWSAHERVWHEHLATLASPEPGGASARVVVEGAGSR